MDSQNKTTPSPPLNPCQPPRGANIRDYLDLLIEGRKAILLSLMTVLALTLIYLLLVPRTYKAQALLQIDKNKALLDATLRGKASAAAAETEVPRMQHEFEILRSRSVIGKVVEDLNLTVEASPVYFPLIGEILARRRDAHDGVSSAWWGFSRWAWGGEKINIAVFNVPDRYLDKEFTLIAMEESRFRLLGPGDELMAEGLVGDSVTVDVDGQAPVIIELTRLDAHAGTHFDIVHKTSLAAIEALLKAFSVKGVSKDTDILKIELKGRDPESLAKSVNDIATIYLNATVNWESAEASQKLDFLENQLPIVKESLEKAEQALNDYRRKQGVIDISPEAENLAKHASEMETLSIQLKQHYDEQSQQLESTHPDMVATKTQIRRINHNLAALEKHIENLPHTQQIMVGLSRNLQVSTGLYSSLLNKLQEQRIAAAGSLGNSRIVDYATTPETPYWPKPGLLLAIATLIGLGLGSVSIFLRRSLQRRDKAQPLPACQNGLPMFTATSPRSGKRLNLVHLSDLGNNREQSTPLNPAPPAISPAISMESLLDLRTNLEATLANDMRKVIMVSSPADGMGKAFVSTNLAASLATIQKRVLIIDADMRNGRLHKRFSVEKQPGLSDLLSGNVSLGDVIVNLPDSGVDLIAKGSTIQHPSDLLARADLPAILEQLKSFYNHIVIDSPPIMETNDAAIIGKHADATFLIVKEGRYTAEELEASFKRFQQACVKPNGFIINGVKEGLSYCHCYGYTYPSAAQETNNSSMWGDKYQAVGDWLGKQLDREILPAAPIIDDTDEGAQI